jgi:hypothetical protein
MYKRKEQNSERTNERTNKQTNKRTSERMNKRNFLITKHANFVQGLLLSCCCCHHLHLKYKIQNLKPSRKFLLADGTTGEETLTSSKINLSKNN